MELLSYDYVIQQIIRKHRSATAAYPYIKDFYFLVLNLLNEKVKIVDIPRKISLIEEYVYITLGDNENNNITSVDFSREQKSEVFIKEAVGTTVRCSICDGLLHKNSITIDHKTRKQDGGIGKVSNGQLAHPYCNSTYKN